MSKRPPMLLTTEDNPYNPFTQWLAWYHEDQRLGYDTPGFRSRLIVFSLTILEKENGTDVTCFHNKKEDTEIFTTSALAINSMLS